MRQILVLGLLAVVGWLLYDKYVATPAEANEVQQPAAPGAASDLLDRALGQAGEPAAPAANQAAVQASGTIVRQAPAALDAERQEAIDELVRRIAGGEVAAIDAGWRALANPALSVAAQQRLGEALAAPPGADFATRRRRLGGSNAFLHSARGRAEAEAALAAALDLPDPELVGAGTDLLQLALRGPIEKADTGPRAFVDSAYERYRARADRWLCNPSNVAGSRSYTVATGDSLNRIARKFSTADLPLEEGTLALLNRISNKNAIRVGQPLKIPAAPIHALVEKRSFSLALYVGDSLLRLYWIGHGKGDKTPVTAFTVDTKIPHPPWTAPDGNVYPYGHPKNILGEYWIGLKGDFTGFGIHGTPMPETIGTMSSDGCIRMLAADIAEVFEILPRKARVEIRANG